MLKLFPTHPPEIVPNFTKLDGCQTFSWPNFHLKLSRGEICVANFIPPVNGASQGNYFLPKSHKLAVYEERKKRLSKTALAAKVANFFSNGFWFWLDERSNNLFVKP